MLFRSVTGLQPVSDESQQWWNQMALCPVPSDERYNYSRLWDEFHIEVPVVRWEGHTFLRVAIQAYNTPSDGDCLIEAIKTILA